MPPRDACDAPEQPTLPPGPTAPSDQTIGLPPPRGEGGPAGLVPGYEVLGELGRGGMGVVYRARQVGLNREVALKMILAGGHAAEAELARFRIEAESLARLAHPNIVGIYEIGDHEGRPYFSLELCPGGSLEKKLAGTPLPPTEAAALVEVLAQALHAAHEAGVVHRDLKPANVLLAADGAPRVTDFGLAKQLGTDSGQTRTGAIMGTPSYMAPEQASGAREVGPLADVWALGAILYECLTGRPPYRAATALDTVMQVVSEEPVPPRQLNAEVPRDLETITLTCLQKAPGRRYATAQALADDLKRWRSGEPIAARPVGAVERAVKWARRRPTLAALLAVCVLAAGLVTGAGVWFTLRVKEERDIAEQERDTAEAERERAARHLYAAQMALAQVAWRGGQVQRARDLLAQSDEGLRGFEWRFMRRLTGRRELVGVGHQSRVLAAALWGEGRPVSADAEGVVWVFGPPPYGTSRGMELNAEMTSFAFGAVGLAAGGGRDGVVRVFDPRAERVAHVEADTRAGPVSAVALSRDGACLASGANDGSVRVWRLGEARGRLPGPAWKVDGHAEQVTALAFSRDGKMLASGGLDRFVQVYEVATGRRLHRLEGHQFGIRSLDWGPDDTLASGSLDASVRLWQGKTGRFLSSLRGHRSAVFSVALSPDGTLLASGSHDQTVCLWSLATGRPLRYLAGHTGAITALGFRPDGKQLITGGFDQVVRVWDVTSDQAPAVLFTDPREKSVEMPPSWSVPVMKSGQNFAVAFAASGEVACAAADGQVHLVRGGKVVQKWRLGGPPALSVAFVGPGRLAAGGATGDLHFLNVEGAQRMTAPKAHGFAVMRLAVQPGGALLATGSLDTTIKLWTLPEGRPVRTLTGHREAVFSVAFAPDGQHLASASYDGTVRLWEVDSGREVHRLTGHDGAVTGVAYSPDGEWLASAGADATWRLWGARTGQPIFVGKGHGRELTGVAFSPDGRRIATGSWDRTLRLWSPQDGLQLLVVPAHEGAVVGFDWSADGGQIVTAGSDGALRLWDGSP